MGEEMYTIFTPKLGCLFLKKGKTAKNLLI